MAVAVDTADRQRARTCALRHLVARGEAAASGWWISMNRLQGDTPFRETIGDGF